MISRGDAARAVMLAQGFGNYFVGDEAAVLAWYMAFEGRDFTLEQVMRAITKHCMDPAIKETVQPKHIIGALTEGERVKQSEVEADVRSAKARGLIEKSWPSRDRLPDDVRDALFTLRDRERRAAADMRELEGSPADVGDVGREPPW